jgi:outer membrane murein-binding lipoprotein Lpp
MPADRQSGLLQLTRHNHQSGSATVCFWGSRLRAGDTMRQIHHPHLTLFASSAALALCCLGGCDRVAQYEALAPDVARLKQQVAELQGDLAMSKANLILMRNDLAAHTGRLDALENPKAQAASGPQRFTPQQVESLVKAISTCVAAARAPNPDHLLPDFDAYYNPANGRVMDNVQYNGQMPARFAFNKCMMTSGWPLN